MDQRVELLELNAYLDALSRSGFVFKESQLDESIDTAKKIKHEAFKYLLSNETVEDVFIFEHAGKKFVSILISKVKEEDRKSCCFS